MNRVRQLVGAIASGYGLAVALVLLCVGLSVATVAEQPATDPAAARRLADDITARVGPTGRVLVAARDTQDEKEFAAAVTKALRAAGHPVVEVVGEPVDVRKALQTANDDGAKFAAIAAPRPVSKWLVFDDLPTRFPALGEVPVLTPKSVVWPNFLKRENLVNVASQIAVVAILAVGMTLVIVSGGIDLSVGSLIALSAVVTARLIRDRFGGVEASPTGMVLGSLGGILVCGVVGLLSGALVAGLRLPPFLVTLGVMLIASGAAYLLTGGESVYQLPPTFDRLGRQADLFGLPNAVVLMLGLYLVAHLLMTRTPLGRSITAVGGNPEAARLAGVPVRRVLLIVYTACGALAGVGGVVMASQLNSGAPTYGQMYELYVIAAVVVGGTSLSGGEGRVSGTLLGALLIAVIQNGMNLTGVEGYTQKVILGLVILGAVLVDRLKASRGP